MRLPVSVRGEDRTLLYRVASVHVNCSTPEVR